MALFRPIVAMLPLSQYLNGFAVLLIAKDIIFRAACSPDCMANGAIPGRGLPPWCEKLATSPMAKTSGWPGTLRSSFTMIRPWRSVSPNCLASGEAAFPAAQTMVRADKFVFELNAIPGNSKHFCTDFHLNIQL